MTESTNREIASPEDVEVASSGAMEILIGVGGPVLVFALWLLWPFWIAPWVKSAAVGAQIATTPPWLAGMQPSQDISTTDSYLAQLGQLGDVFGGVNALFAALAVVAVIWAGYLQRVALTEARRQIRKQATELSKQNDSRISAQFERNFYELLRLTFEILNRFRVKSRTGVQITGSAALDAVASNYFGEKSKFPFRGEDDDKRLEFLVGVYQGKVYDVYASKIGPFFRLLYQIFELIHDSDIEEDKKVRFSKVARGQLSEGTVLLIALNGVTSRGSKFVRHIEEWGLLEHMHPAYLDKYKNCLLRFYEETAFQGSEERAETRRLELKYQGRFKAEAKSRASVRLPDDKLPSEEIEVD